MGQGVKNNPLFQHHSDYKKYYSILDEASISFPFTLLAFCLLPNRVHLLIQTKDDHISKVMHSINTPYARWYNKKYDYKGSVFEQPYRWFPIPTEKDLIITSAYVHNNPRLTLEGDSPMDHPWSSYHSYTKPEIITSNSRLPPVESLVPRRLQSFYFQQSPKEQFKLFPFPNTFHPPPTIFSKERITQLFPSPIYDYYGEFVNKIWEYQESKMKTYY
ncbi:MAG: transposase [Bacillus sp. (in: Bacteria)]|nr:transposase [Bacillus sp. (in: firmicutes)]